MNKIEQMKHDKDGLDVWPDLLHYAATDTPVDQIPEDELNRMKWFGIFHRPQRPGTFMMRLRVTGGRLNSAQLRAIARISRDLLRRSRPDYPSEHPAARTPPSRHPLRADPTIRCWPAFHADRDG